MKKFLFLFGICGLLSHGSLTAGEITLRDVILGAQERHMAVRQREALMEAHRLRVKDLPGRFSLPDVSTYLNEVEVQDLLLPLNFPHLTDAEPAQGAVDGLTLKQRIEVLAYISLQLDVLKHSYLNMNVPDGSGVTVVFPTASKAPEGPVFTEQDLPTVGGIHPDNYHAQLQRLGSHISRLQVLMWPALDLVGERDICTIATDHEWACFSLSGFDVIRDQGRILAEDGDPPPATFAPEVDYFVYNDLLKDEEVTEVTAEEIFDYYDNEGYGNFTDPSRPLTPGQFGHAHVYYNLPRYYTETEESYTMYGFTPGHASFREFLSQYEKGSAFGNISGTLYDCARLEQYVNTTNGFIAETLLDRTDMEIDPGVAEITEEVTNNDWSLDPLVGTNAYDADWESSGSEIDYQGTWQTTFSDSPVTPNWAATGLDSTDYFDWPEVVPVFDNPLLNGTIEATNERPVVSDSYPENYAFFINYHRFGLFVPTFQYLGDPATSETLGPGTLGRDGVAVNAVPREFYRIELGSGRYRRGNQGSLVAGFNEEDEFELRFVGDLNEYEYEEDSSTSGRYTYEGDWVETIVDRSTDNQIKVTQKLLTTVPGGEVPGTEIRKFQFQITSASTTLTCTYSGGVAAVTRTWTLEPTKIRVGPDPLNPVQQWELILGQVSGVEQPVTVVHKRDGAIVRQSDYTLKNFARLPDVPIPSTVEYHSLCGESNRTLAREFLHTEVLPNPDYPYPSSEPTLTVTSPLPSKITWDGPGASEQTLSPEGLPISRTDAPFTHLSGYGATGDIFQTASQYAGNGMQTVELTWSSDAAGTLFSELDGSTGYTRWEPGGTLPTGQVPYGLRQINHPNGTSVTVRDILGASSRTVTIFQGEVDGSGGEVEGQRTTLVYNMLGQLTSRQVKWKQDSTEVMRVNESFVQSRLGPTQHTDTDGFDSTFTWNGAGENLTVTGRSLSTVVNANDLDASGRPEIITETLTGVVTDLDYNGRLLTHTYTGDGNTVSGTGTVNGFGENIDSGYAGAQPTEGTGNWVSGVWTTTGENNHTHAEIKHTYNEDTLQEVYLAKTGTGNKVTVSFESVDDIACMKFTETLLKPGLTETGSQAVRHTWVDGSGRTRQVSVPNASSGTLSWSTTTYQYDAQNRLEHIDRPVLPDVLIEYDSLSRPYRQALDLDGDGEMEDGTDLVTETTYTLQGGEWVETRTVWMTDSSQKTLSELRSNAVARTFDHKIGNRAPDKFLAETVASGHERIQLNGRALLERTPTELSLTDNSNAEALPISQRIYTVNALGEPVSDVSSNGLRTRQVTFNPDAEPFTTNDAGISSTHNHDFQSDGSSTHDTVYGSLPGPTANIDPGAETTNIGGGGGMPHNTGFDWLSGGGWRQTLSLNGGTNSEWKINPAGLVTQKTFANGDQNSFVYDEVGRLLRKTTPAGVQSWTHLPQGGVKSWKIAGVTKLDVVQTDVLGRPTRIKDDSGERTLVYENDNWTLDTVEWTDGALQGFKLDENADSRGRPDTLTVSKNSTTFYSTQHTYRGESDHIDDMMVTIPGGPTVSIAYIGAGGKADSLTYTVGSQTTTYTRSRNPHGRPNGITAPGFTQSWDLDDMGRIHELTTNGTTSTYGYDETNGSLASVVVDEEVQRTYTFSHAGVLTEETINDEELVAPGPVDESGALAGQRNPRTLKIRGRFHPNAVVEVFVGATNRVYDTSSTPFEFTFSDSTVPALAISNAVVNLDWSVVGTRLQEPGGTVFEGGKAVAKVAGEHLFAPAQETITYDISTRRASDAFLNYDWDGADQPLRLEQRHGPTSTEHVYDGSQRRVAKKVYENGSLIRTHRYVYQGWLPIVEEVTDRWGNPEYRNSYVWGPGPNGVRNPGIGATGQLALIIHQPQYGDPELSAPVYNHRLDVVGLVDVETGNVVAEYDYTPFGKTRRATGARAEQCPFRFAGAYLDEETRTYYFGYRHYDPRTKQWLSRDPIGEAGGLNLFAYANNDPINHYDVLGLRTVPWDTGWKVVDGVPMVRLGEMEMSFWTNSPKGIVPGSEEWVPATGKWLRSFQQTPNGWIYPGVNVARRQNIAAAAGDLEEANRQGEMIGLGYWATIGVITGGLQSFFVAEEISSKGFFIWYHAARESGQQGLFWWAGTLAAAGGGATMQPQVTAPPPRQAVSFYVTPDGVAVPGTGYRYFSGNRNLRHAEEGVIPGREDGLYVAFTVHNTDVGAGRHLQTPYNPQYRAAFDSLQIIPRMRSPYNKWDTGTIPEPYTFSFPWFGKGGVSQAKAYGDITLIPESLTPLLRVEALPAPLMPQPSYLVPPAVEPAPVMPPFLPPAGP